jgi:inorganic pyrophosphatase
MIEVALIVPSGVAGILFAAYLYQQVASISLKAADSDQSALIEKENEKLVVLEEIYEKIRSGANAFLKAEYTICAIFIVLFGIVVFIATAFVPDENGNTHADWKVGGLTCASFVTGAVTSIISGYIGMTVAVFSNARTTVSAMPAIADNEASKQKGWTGAFNTAFRAGGVMGFSLCGLGMLVLFALCELYSLAYTDYKDIKKDDRVRIFECIAGFGLGGSSIALFGRVGGGIYTKAADVGADLAGKVVEDIPEDDPRNPATIADNVGDNVGDVAGMGSDLFGSFAEASCAALVVGASCTDTGEWNNSGDLWVHLMFPIALSAAGILVCIVCFFVATHVYPVKKEADVETVLKIQLAVTTVVLTGVIYCVALGFLPHGGTTFKRVGGAPDDAKASTVDVTPIKAWGCVCAGLWSGCIIGFVTEYYTSHSYTPVRDVAQSCLTGGAATNIIYGLALGFQSCIVPVALLSIDVYVSFQLADMYGVALCALGMLSNLATCLSIDVYGPVCDNAGGIAEMSELDEKVRDVTDALDAAGNTTAAIGKGFAIGSACLVGLALFGAFVTRSKLMTSQVSILSPIIFACLLFGAMIPYWFSAMTMKSVGLAANEMVVEVARQFRDIPGLLKGEINPQTGKKAEPDCQKCIDISTKASLREMVLPAVLVMTTPLLCGFLFGSAAVAGLLAGAIVSSVQMAISQSNTGGAWDNAKKYVEKGRIVQGYGTPGARIEEYPANHEKAGQNMHGKGSECHKAAVVGDTVGDPLKDTSGPALNIVMKLMAILSLVFADSFRSVNHGRGAFNIYSS